MIRLKKPLKNSRYGRIQGATLVGIRREGQTLLSPSPKDTIKLHDRLLYVGDPQSSIRLGEYMRIQMEGGK